MLAVTVAIVGLPLADTPATMRAPGAVVTGFGPLHPGETTGVTAGCNAEAPTAHISGMDAPKPLLRRRLTWVALTVAVVAAVAAALVFEPWKLVLDRTVAEAVPTASAPPP